jgi:hypothetical protein
LAQRFVGQLSNPRIHGQKSNTAEHLGVADNLGPPVLTPELLYMMLPGKSIKRCNMIVLALIDLGTDKRTNSQGTYVWPDHITDKTLERMGLAIIERSEGEPVLHLYRISVWVKALSCISKMAPLISSAPLRVHFRALKKQYEAAANEELDSISLTAVPSLPLLQALLSGVSYTLSSLVFFFKFFLKLNVLETPYAILGQHVTILDVQCPRIEDHRRTQLPQYHRPCATQ